MEEMQSKRISLALKSSYRAKERVSAHKGMLYNKTFVRKGCRAGFGPAATW